MLLHVRASVDIYICRTKALTLHFWRARSNNIAGASGGGGLYAERGSNATLTNCVAANNSNTAAAKVRPQQRACGFDTLTNAVLLQCRAAASSSSRAPRQR